MSQKWISLTNLLLSSSKSGQIVWQETASQDIYQVIISNNIVEVERMLEQEIPQYQIRIRHRSGKLVDKFTDDDLHSLVQSDWFSKIGNMFDDIIRKNSGADDVLDDIINELVEKEIPF